MKCVKIERKLGRCELKFILFYKRGEKEYMKLTEENQFFLTTRASCKEHDGSLFILRKQISKNIKSSFLLAVKSSKVVH